MPGLDPGIHGLVPCGTTWMAGTSPGHDAGRDRACRDFTIVSGAFMHILIFGGTGFVGLYIAQGLLEGGHAVTLFDRAGLPSAAQRAFAGFGDRLRVLQGDVTDTGAV